jgi:hypothetical protein
VSVPAGRGTIPSPNIWGTSDVYEIENLASDRAGVIDAAIDALQPWAAARGGCANSVARQRM